MDWIAAVFELFGSYAIGSKSRNGFIVQGVANVVWITIGVRTGLWGLAAICTVALIMNVRNYRKWSKETHNAWSRSSC